jgi:hypothetical protein
MTWASYQEALECLDDFAAERPLEALRRGYAKYLSHYRLDACATAEPAAALVHAYDRLSPERRAWCLTQTGDLRFVPDHLEPERREAIRRREGRA